ncbi:hypothetical protein Agub_g13481 [Astrephomene gubernaculifera]|uniref:Uncharacterized protein n=1 Tax=Astrephomene gubernaculifera TaxID=47775 RepID=A0AAD3E2H1_9CHLO|nr:hypothetical protein Agub_g13481 [Astrephomene gubernaculifera]
MPTVDSYYDMLAANEKRLEEGRNTQRQAVDSPRSMQLREQYLRQAVNLGLIPAKFYSPPATAAQSPRPSTAAAATTASPRSRRVTGPSASAVRHSPSHGRGRSNTYGGGGHNGSDDLSPDGMARELVRADLTTRSSAVFTDRRQQQRLSGRARDQDGSMDDGDDDDHDVQEEEQEKRVRFLDSRASGRQAANGSSSGSSSNSGSSDSEEYGIRRGVPERLHGRSMGGFDGRGGGGSPASRRRRGESEGGVRGLDVPSPAFLRRWRANKQKEDPGGHVVRFLLHTSEEIRSGGDEDDEAAAVEEQQGAVPLSGRPSSGGGVGWANSPKANASTASGGGWAANNPQLNGYPLQCSGGSSARRCGDAVAADPCDTDCGCGGGGGGCAGWVSGGCGSGTWADGGIAGDAKVCWSDPRHDTANGGWSSCGGATSSNGPSGDDGAAAAYRCRSSFGSAAQHPQQPAIIRPAYDTPRTAYDQVYDTPRMSYNPSPLSGRRQVVLSEAGATAAASARMRNVSVSVSPRQQQEQHQQQQQHVLQSQPPYPEPQLQRQLLLQQLQKQQQQQQQQLLLSQLQEQQQQSLQSPSPPQQPGGLVIYRTVGTQTPVPLSLGGSPMQLNHPGSQPTSVGGASAAATRGPLPVPYPPHPNAPTAAPQNHIGGVGSPAMVPHQHHQMYDSSVREFGLSYSGPSGDAPLPYAGCAAVPSYSHACVGTSSSPQLLAGGGSSSSTEAGPGATAAALAANGAAAWVPYENPSLGNSPYLGTARSHGGAVPVAPNVFATSYHEGSHGNCRTVSYDDSIPVHDDVRFQTSYDPYGNTSPPPPYGSRVPPSHSVNSDSSFFAAMQQQQQQQYEQYDSSAGSSLIGCGESQTWQQRASSGIDVAADPSPPQTLRLSMHQTLSTSSTSTNGIAPTTRPGVIAPSPPTSLSGVSNAIAHVTRPHHSQRSSNSSTSTNAPTTKAHYSHGVVVRQSSCAPEASSSNCETSNAVFSRGAGAAAAEGNIAVDANAGADADDVDDLDSRMSALVEATVSLGGSWVIEDGRPSPSLPSTSSPSAAALRATNRPAGGAPAVNGWEERFAGFGGPAGAVRGWLRDGAGGVGGCDAGGSNEEVPGGGCQWSAAAPREAQWAEAAGGDGGAAAASVPLPPPPPHESVWPSSSPSAAAAAAAGDISLRDQQAAVVREMQVLLHRLADIRGQLGGG